MGAKELLTWVKRASSEEAVAIVAEAERKAVDMHAEGEAECEKVARDVRSEYERKTSQERLRILASQRMVARRTVVEQKEKLIERVFDEARNALVGLVDRPEYTDILVRLVVEGGTALGGGSLVALVRKEDVGILRPRLPGIQTAVRKATGHETAITVQEADRAITGGVVVASKDGARRVDNTLQARMDAMDEELRTVAARELFEDGEG